MKTILAYIALATLTIIAPAWGLIAATAALGVAAAAWIKSYN
jgi:hypothetical protein